MASRSARPCALATLVHPVHRKKPRDAGQLVTFQQRRQNELCWFNADE
jgi:hypothetical protein